MGRAERVAEIIKKEISEILRKDISDPRIGFISITHVDIADDLKNAIIHVSVFESEEKKQNTMDGLNSAKRYIRSLLAPRLDIKTMPDISFKLDNSIERAGRVFEIMQKLEQEKTRNKPKRKKK